MKVNRKILQAHFKISRSTYFENFKGDDWQVIDTKVAESNGGREVRIPSGEALRTSQALAYLSGEGLLMNRTTLWRKEQAGDITPVYVTSDIKIFVKSDLANLLKPFCYNLQDVNGLNILCQSKKGCNFSGCTWHNFFELI